MNQASFLLKCYAIAEDEGQNHIYFFNWGARKMWQNTETSKQGNIERMQTNPVFQISILILSTDAAAK